MAAVPSPKLREGKPPMFWPAWNGTPGKGIGELRRDVGVGKQIVAMGVEVIEAETKFVHQVVAKSVDLAGRQALGCVVAVAILKAATVEHVVERRGQEITVVAVTVAGEKIILVAEWCGRCECRICFLFRCVPDRPGSCRRAECVLGGAGNKFASSWASGSIAVFVPLLPVNLLVGCPVAGGADGDAAGSAVVRRISLRQGRIKDLSLVSRVAAAVEHARRCGLLSLEKRGEISANFGWRGNRGQLRQRLANAQAFVVSEKEQFVLDDGPAQRKAELVLLVRLAGRRCRRR